MKILICCNYKKEKSLQILPEVIRILKDSGAEPVFTESARPYINNDSFLFTADDSAVESCDILLTIGGDGTILKWGKKAAFAGKPLLGINTGRLGFMTCIEINELEKLSVLTNGNYSFSKRMLLDITLETTDESITKTALNDVVISRDFYSKLPEFEVLINGITVSRIRADGVIFSTPTGSTAYALSAGGPIIEPGIECIEMTFLCAHTLLNRPMIFSARDVITVSFKGYEGSTVGISIDGDGDIRFTENDRLIIKKSDTFFNLIDIGNASFYNAVNNKLIRSMK